MAGVLEEAGLAAEPAPELVPVEELQQRLDQGDRLNAEFESLTPGRRREYNLYFSGAKQAATRGSWVERCAQRILAGKGLRDRADVSAEESWGMSTWQFAIQPGAVGRSRLLTRGRSDYSPGWATRLAFGRFPIEPVTFVMSRKMMLEVKRLAEANR